MILVAGLHLASWRCFLGVSAAVFATILTVVHTYVISTAAMSGPATYSTLLALRPRGATPVSPPPQPVCDRLCTLGLWAPCRPVWSRDGDPGLRFVRRRCCRAGRRAKRKQTLSADPTCPQLSSPAPNDDVSKSVHLQSSDISTSGHFCAITTTSSRCVATVESTCCVSPRRGMTPTAPSSVVCYGPATDRVHAPLTTTCVSTMAASSSFPPPTSVCRRLPSLNRPPSNSSVLKLPLEVPPSSSSFFIDPAARRCSRSSSTAG